MGRARFSDDERAKLLAACLDLRWRTLIYLALTAGFQVSELLELTWNRVSVDKPQLIVTGTTRKRDRMQPLPPEAVGMLRELQASIS